MLLEFHINLLKYKIHVCNLEVNLRVTRKALFQKVHHQHFWLHRRLYQTIKMNIQLSSVQLLSRVQLFATPATAARQASMSITNSRSPPKPKSIESVMPSNHLILCCPLLLLPLIFPSIRVFSNESALCIRWPKYWSVSFNISPTNEHPGLISFKMDWLDLLAVKGTLKGLLQWVSSSHQVARVLELQL